MLCRNCFKQLGFWTHKPAKCFMHLNFFTTHKKVSLFNTLHCGSLQNCGLASSASSPEGKWTRPEGFDTGILIYNPLIKEKVPLILKKEKIAQWYACGPTVYEKTHIGHASSYVRLDIIRRVLSSVFDVDTTLVMGITDVDDKIILKSLETGEPIDKITRMYEAEFFSDLNALNVSPPNIITRVREHIPQIISFNKVIEGKGLAYKTPDGSVYFDVKNYGKYGRFAVQKDASTSQEDGNVSIKRNSQDFALWKAAKDGEPWWDSPWGRGRPGWHVECSAMASGIFGANFDIHSGGEDLVFPHHENEIAQSCAFHGNDQWVNYWIHTGHLYVAGQTDKMSKSLKNVISIPDFLADYSSNHFRMLCLLSNYKKRIEFSDERMQKAVSVLSAINNAIDRCGSYVQGKLSCSDIPEAQLYEKLQLTRRAVRAGLADDFNTPQVLAHVMRLVKFSNQLLVETGTSRELVTTRSCAPVAAVGVFLQRLLQQLGCDAGKRNASEETEAQVHFHRAVDSAVSARSKMRNFAKDKQHMIKSAAAVDIPEEKASKLMKALYKPLWEASDTIRDDILQSANVQINDGVDGSTWSVADPRRKTKQNDEASQKDDTASKEPS